MFSNQVCVGKITHSRYKPRHKFTYSVSMLCIDVSSNYELSWLSKFKSWSPLRLGPKEWWGSEKDLLSGLNCYLKDSGYLECDRVFMLAQPRSFGFYFNPVCFYFCLREGALSCILTEIHNTPWGEKHSYVLDASDTEQGLEFSFDKEFHVSPFLSMDLKYCWKFRIEENRTRVVMQVLEGEKLLLSTGLDLAGSEMTIPLLRKVTFRYPLQNFMTLWRIYWQALILYLKRAEFFEHPKSTKEGL